MTYKGPERRDITIPEDTRLERDVDKIITRVIEENIPLHEIKLREDGIAREKIIQSVREKFLVLLQKAQSEYKGFRRKKTSNDLERLLILFGVHSSQQAGAKPAIKTPQGTGQPLEPKPMSRKSSRPRIPQFSRRPTPKPGLRVPTPKPARHIPTLPPEATIMGSEPAPKAAHVPENSLEFATRLFEYGELYLPPNVSFEELKKAVECRFIIACREPGQQQEVLDIVANLKKEDIQYKGPRGKFYLFCLNSNVLSRLKIVSELTSEERTGNKKEVFQQDFFQDTGVKIDS